MIKYAKISDEGLKTKMPRVPWITPKWSPSAMGDILGQLATKRKSMQGKETLPDMMQRTLQLTDTRGKRVCTGSTTTPKQPENIQQNANPVPEAEDIIRYPDVANVLPSTTSTEMVTIANEGRHRTGARSGPCAFGCAITTNIRNGRQVWKIPPKPCPWRNIAADASLCNRCYSKGVALRDKAAAEFSMRRELETLDKRRLDHAIAAATHGGKRRCVTHNDGTDTARPPG